MARLEIAIGLAIVLAAACGTAAEPGGAEPSYQRQRGAGRYGSPEQRPPQRPPRYRPNKSDWSGQQQPTVGAGTFQRPYPYHLDFYKREYGGTYEPYFGNLYGPPNVVLGAPWGAYGYGGYPYMNGAYGAGPYAGGYQPGYPAAVQPLVAAPVIVCPHCGQPIHLEAQGVTGTMSP